MGFTLSMDVIICLLVLLSIIWISVLFLKPKSFKAQKSARNPPGPNPLPIIGNILELGPNPHLSLTKLSRKYGPLMSLKLGSLTTVVVSSPEIARSVLQTHDLTFSSRSVPVAARAVEHEDFSMVWLPANSQWRKLRKICKEQMFSISRLDESQSLRKEKLQKLHDYVNECRRKGRAVDIGKAAFTTSLNLMSATLFSVESAQFDSNTSQEMKEIVWGMMKYTGTPNLADYFPVLKRVDPQGIYKKIKFYCERLFEIFERIIDEKLRYRASGDGDKKKDLVEALLDLYDRDQISINDIKHLLLDLFVAGTDTTSVTIEWAMTELIRHPEKMARVRDEIRDVIGENREIQESDISKLPFLQAVVKETFRLHPAGAFLVPHKAEADIEINGFLVPKYSQVLVNVWAIGRDPDTWSDVDLFKPERFLDLDCNEIDFRGKDFELIPFGAGRRICPGLPLAYRMVHLMLSTFIQNFGWRLENGQKPEELDMSEKFGLTLEKAMPLVALPIEP